MPTSLSRLFTRKILPGMLPVVAVVLFAVTDESWLGYGWCLLTLAFFAVMFRRFGVGAGRTARALIVSAVLLGTALFKADELDVPLVVSGALLMWLIGFEPVVFGSLKVGRLKTANLELARNARWLQPATVAVINLVLITAFVVTAAVDVSAWPLVGLTLITAVANLGAPATAWLNRRRSAYQADGEVRAAVEKHEPLFAVYFSGPASSQYQLLMWLPYFDMLGDPYVVILREGRNLNAFAQATSAPVVVAPSIASMENMLVPSIRAVFYANNSMKNTHCVRFGELIHIQLMHGDSEKPASRNPVSAMYDRVFVAGQAGVDRYRRYGVNISDSQFRIVGRPQVADIRFVDRPISAVDSPTVLYAPTWTGDSADVNFSSLPLGEALVTQLLERGATVWLREHPFTRRNAAAARQLDRVQEILQEDRERTGRQHRFGAETSGDVTFSDCCNASDAMIGDVSGVISDWLYSGKPFAVADMLDEGEEFTESFPLSQASYVVRSHGGNISEVLDQLLDTDMNAHTRHAMRAHYLGDFPEDRYVEGFLNAARDCYSGPPPNQIPRPAEGEHDEHDFDSDRGDNDRDLTKQP